MCLCNSLPLTQPAEFRYDMSAYILYQNQTIPEKWGDSLGIVQCQDRSGGVLLSLFVATRWRQDLLLGGRDWPSRSSNCRACSKLCSLQGGAF